MDYGVKIHKLKFRNVFGANLSGENVPHVMDVEGVGGGWWQAGRHGG